MHRWKRALVTGASTGIGRAIAVELARRGSDLVVVARDEARLRSLAEELSVAVEVIVADLAVPGDVQRVADRVAEDTEPIDLVVNNAGFGVMGPLADGDIDAHVGMIDVNVTALVRLSHAALAAMPARGGGAVLNVSSVAGFIPSPEGAVYSASKSFVTSFSQALGVEGQRDGVAVSVVCPGFTRTEFQARAEFDDSTVPDRLWQSPEAVAKAALDGLDDGRLVVVPGAQNKLAASAMRIMPMSLQRRIADLF